MGAGAHVALLAQNSNRWAQAAHAIARLGAALVPINTRLTVSELAWQLQDVEASLVVYDAANAVKMEELAAHLPGLSALPLQELTDPCDAGPPDNVALHCDLDRVHSIIYTSGTTGQPKGVLLTHGAYFWNAVGSALNLGLRDDDRWLVCLPLFHVGGLSILLRSLVYGAAAVIHDRFDPAAANRAIDEDGITIMSVVSNMLQRMLAERGDRPYPPHFRCFLLGGGPAPQPLLEACAARGIPVMQTYGLTEAASQVATLAPEDALSKLGSAGKPLFPVELRIAGEDDAPLPPGAPGEIVVRGPTVTPGYFKQPEATAVALRGGWLHTGDIGYLDGDGYLYVLDRRDDLVISGGENVYPAEVEAVLMAHPAVVEAGVIGLTDEQWGQVVAASVVLRAGAPADSADILAFCAERLAPYKVPKHVRFEATLPRNAAGKLLRQSLRRAWSKDATGPG
jgi:O-succinylbenzoic acid--CoA ligase